MVIRALDIVQFCNTAKDGEEVRAKIVPFLRNQKQVELSFDGVEDVPSSFINAAIVTLLNEFDVDFLRKHLVLREANSQIADMVVRCMANGIRALRA